MLVRQMRTYRIVYGSWWTAIPAVFTLVVACSRLIGTAPMNSPAMAAGAVPNHWVGAWAAPQTPRVPRKPVLFNGVRCTITGPREISSGKIMDVEITVINHSARPIGIPGQIQPWLVFPGTWCWGPNNILPAPLLRYVMDGYRAPEVGSRMASAAMPRESFRMPLPLSFSHIFDLSVPGKYQAQLAGMGVVSNVIKFRVLPPRDKPNGPAVREFPAKLPKGFAWGSGWHSVQMAAYVKSNPGIANPMARVQILFRCAGKHAATISLTGNPHIDFARRKMIGPFHTFKAIDGKPVPLTAYGRLLADHRQSTATAKAYTLKPGVIYTYWRPLVLNREFDLSVYGPYEFSARLHGAELKTAPATMYVGVQSRFYKHLKIPG